ncbi:hypothetical protein ACIPIN_08545 [Pseudomonas sp. NPDC087697]|uniref:hypothetical protein n=1 Tax=Pseudomonas sp. NPDC087697 TaxID=3364447 RepID=UPI0038133C3F
MSTITGLSAVKIKLPDDQSAAATANKLMNSSSATDTAQQADAKDGGQGAVKVSLTMSVNEAKKTSDDTMSLAVKELLKRMKDLQEQLQQLQQQLEVSNHTKYAVTDSQNYRHYGYSGANLYGQRRLGTS